MFAPQRVGLASLGAWSREAEADSRTEARTGLLARTRPVLHHYPGTTPSESGGGSRNRAVRAAHGAPDDLVKQQVIDRVFPGEVHLDLAAPRVRAVTRFHIHIRRERLVGAQIR